jgi:hypothetical protein
VRDTGSNMGSGSETVTAQLRTVPTGMVLSSGAAGLDSLRRGMGGVWLASAVLGLVMLL